MKRSFFLPRYSKHWLWAFSRVTVSFLFLAMYFTFTVLFFTWCSGKLLRQPDNGNEKYWKCYRIKLQWPHIPYFWESTCCYTPHWTGVKNWSWGPIQLLYSYLDIGIDLPWPTHVFPWYQHFFLFCDMKVDHDWPVPLPMACSNMSRNNCPMKIVNSFAVH